MTLTVTQKTSGSAGATNTPASASITPTANKLVLAVVTWCTSSSTSENNVGSGAGNSLTWVRVNEKNLGFNNVDFPFNRAAGIYRAMGSSPSAGSFTFTYGGGSSLISSTHAIIEIGGTIETSGTNGSGAVGSVDVAGDILLSGSGNIPFTVPGTPVGDDITLVISHTEDGQTLTAPSGFANVSYETGGSDTITRIDYDVDKLTSGNVGYTASGDRLWLTQGLIIKALSGTTRGTPFGHRGTAFNGGRTFNGIIT